MRISSRYLKQLLGPKLASPQLIPPFRAYNRLRHQKTQINHSAPKVNTGIKAIFQNIHAVPPHNVDSTERLTLSYESNLTPQMLIQGMRHFPNVRDIMLHGWHPLTDQHMLSILRQLPKLTSLGLYLCPRLTDGLMSTLAQKSLPLEAIELSKVSFNHTGLSTLAKLGHLRHLTLRDSNKLGHASVVVAAKHCTLETLDVSGLDGINVATLAALNAHTSTLQRANFSNIAAVDPVFLSHFVKQNPSLRVLDICLNDQITNRSIEHVVAACPQLEVLSTSFAKKLTNDVTASLAEHGKNIRNLSLAYMPNLTDEGISTLSQGCQKLEHLDVSGCNKLTTKSLMTLKTHCPNLKEVLCHGTRMQHDRLPQCESQSHHQKYMR